MMNLLMQLITRTEVLARRMLLRAEPRLCMAKVHAGTVPGKPAPSTRMLS